MYNETLYEMRQYFFDNGEYLNYYNAWERLKNDSWNYERLPSQVAPLLCYRENMDGEDRW